MNNTNKNSISKDFNNENERKLEENFAELFHKIHDPSLKITLFHLIQSIAENEQSV